MIQTPTKHKFTVEDVMLMEKAGILGADERIELIDGELVGMSPILPPHAITVNNLNRLLIQNTTDDIIVSVQNAFFISNNTILEPDLVIAKSSEKLLSNELIKPNDAEIVIEVSDSTYKTDKGRKLEIYAASGVKEYWIVNIGEQQIEVHTAPEGQKYTSIKLVSGELHTSLGFTFQVKGILPKE